MVSTMAVEDESVEDCRLWNEQRQRKALRLECQAQGSFRAVPAEPRHSWQMSVSAECLAGVSKINGDTFDLRHAGRLVSLVREARFV